MYHLLVTANAGAWDLPAYEFPRDRFCEYTPNIIRERFKELTAAAIEELKAYPALFTYEDETQNARVGYIRHVKVRSRSLQIEYQFEPAIPEFPFVKLDAFKMQLHIQGWEMNRTHWAIKEKELFEVLAAAGVVDASFLNPSEQDGRVEEMRFKVALSFPGEHRKFVSDIAAELKRRLGRGSVFYDDYFTAQLARPNLDTLLQRIYLQNSDLVVVFLCADYERKEWPGIEWRAIREIIKNRDENSVMLMRFDDAPVRGVLSIDGYVDLRHRTPFHAAQLILERVRLNDADFGEAGTAP